MATAALPSQSSQQKNIIIENRIQLGQFVTKITPPATTLIQGEWVIIDPTTDAWARAASAFSADAIKACFPVLGKPSEHMNKALRPSAGAAQGMVEVYLGAFPMIVKTKVYDSDDTFAVGDIAYIGDIVHGGVTYSGFTDASETDIPAGRVLTAPSTSNGNWLRVLVTFC